MSVLRLGPLVSSDWLAANLGRVKLLDATWFMPTMGKDADAEFRSRHLPGARRFDVDAISDSDRGLPHMLPTPAHFSGVAGKLGISSEDHVVVYDSTAIMTAATRAYWTFRALGHDRVSVLDGGLGAWVGGGRPVEAGETTEPIAPGRFEASLQRSLLATSDDVLRASAAAGAGAKDFPVLVDARSRGRFTALGEDEPWRPVYPDIRRGRVPHSRNVPAGSLLGPDGRFKEPDAIRSLFAAAGVPLDDPEREIIVSCGSGVTAATLFVGLELVGHRAARLYDGSWCEWGNRADLPVATGEDQ